MPGVGSVACPKPAKGDAKRARRRDKRAETPVISAVRTACVDRDGYCRLQFPDDGSGSSQAVQALFGACHGPSEWAHVGKAKRWKTRNMAPDARHATAHSLMLCRLHHQSDLRGYDRSAFEIEYADPTRGCDGPLRFITRAGEEYWEAGAERTDG